ncbi:MAG: transcription antitermination factor NusB [Terriglobia bacterium]
MASRRKARELALQMLFQWDVGQHSPEQVVATFLTPRKLAPETRQFACTLFEGAVREMGELDGLLRSQAEHWRLERMAAVDRNILRLGLYELLHSPEIPHPVVLDEALELARRFSTMDSVSFINGILDGILKSRAGIETSESGAKP